MTIDFTSRSKDRNGTERLNLCNCRTGLATENVTELFGVYLPYPKLDDQHGIGGIKPSVPRHGKRVEGSNAPCDNRSASDADERALNPGDRPARAQFGRMVDEAIAPFNSDDAGR